MNYQRTLRIYEWISYICRLMMERTRRLAADAENDQLKDDLRRLTQLYAEEKKKNNA